MASKSAAVAEPTTHTLKVEDAGPCRKRLTFEIPAQRIAETVANRMGDLAGTVALPGFRAGRAPRALIERRFGQSVRDDVRQSLSVEAYQAAIKEHGLRVLGEAEGGEELKDADMSGQKALKFSVEVEVAPEIALPALDGLKLLKPRFPVTDEMVDKEVELLKTNEGELAAREQAEAGDYCVGHGILRDADGNTIVDIAGAVIQVPTPDKKGEGMILGVKVADFGKQIGLPKPGDEKVIKTKGPENHENETIRGKPITISFKVTEIHRIIPATIERLLERFGLENADALREAIRRRLEQRAMIEQQAAMRAQVARHLLDSVKFDLPERITARQAERNLARRRLEMMHQGVDPARIEEHIAEMRGSSNEVAQRELKLFFLLDAVANLKGVRVTEGEVNGRIAQMAFARGVRPDTLRSELIRTNQAGFIVQQVREHKALDAVVAGAEVTETSLEEARKALEGAGG